MTYQPLYATVRDPNATRHTTSLRNRVEWIEFNLNSHFGEVISINADSEGTLTEKTYNRMQQCKRKIREFEEKGNIKKVKEWKKKLKEAEESYKELEKKEEVRVFINLRNNPKFKYFINDIELTAEDIKLFKENLEIFREALNKVKVIKELK